MVLTICSTIGLQTWHTLFNNFAVEVVGLEGNHIGVIQSVRKIPGFLTLLVVLPVLGGVLLMLDYRIPFILSAGLSIISLAVVQKINTNPPPVFNHESTQRVTKKKMLETTPLGPLSHGLSISLLSGFPKPKNSTGLKMWIKT